MALRTYYTDLNLAALRRIIGPVSVLSARGKRVYYEPLPRPFAVFGAGNDSLLVADWRPEPEELAPPFKGALIYDLSDAQLLDDAQIRAGISMAHAVLVPNLATANLARRYCANVIVAPTHVHWEWLRQAPANTPPNPMALLLSRGRDSWAELIEPVVDPNQVGTPTLPPLVQWLRANPELRLVSDDMAAMDALEAQVGKERCFYSPFEATTWPLLLRSSFLLLAPGRDQTADVAPLFEAAMVGVPSLVGEGYSAGELALTCRSRQQWTEQLLQLTSNDRKRRLLAEYALGIARRATAVQGADAWLRRVEKAARGAPAMALGRVA